MSECLPNGSLRGSALSQLPLFSAAARSLVFLVPRTCFLVYILGLLWLECSAHSRDPSGRPIQLGHTRALPPRPFGLGRSTDNRSTPSTCLPACLCSRLRHICKGSDRTRCLATPVRHPQSMLHECPPRPLLCLRTPQTIPLIHQMGARSSIRQDSRRSGAEQVDPR